MKQDNQSVNLRVIEKIINDNYIVFKAFDVADGDMIFRDFIHHITKERRLVVSAKFM